MKEVAENVHPAARHPSSREESGRSYLPPAPAILTSPRTQTAACARHGDQSRSHSQGHESGRIYDADPVKVANAKLYPEISYLDVLTQGLGVMDSTAISL